MHLIWDNTLVHLDGENGFEMALMRVIILSKGGVLDKCNYR